MVKAVIFDMDGVISDTQGMHAEIEEKFLEEYGIDMPADEITAKYAGYSDGEFYKAVFSEYGVASASVDKAVSEIWKRKFAAIKGGVSAIPGVKELIANLHGDGFKLAVASASIPEFIGLILSSLGLTGKFDVIVSSVEVEKGKPEPDIFLLAAKKLGVGPKDCVVIEDGINGMIAAKKAGMKCIGIVKKEGEYPADLIITNFNELSPEKIKAL